MACANRDNLSTVYVLLCIAGLGIGGILVPASIITTIVCPDDLIATISALTLAIRVVGGSIGYAIYYNVFYNKFVPILTKKVGGKPFQFEEKEKNIIVDIDTNIKICSNNDSKRIPGCDGHWRRD